MALITCPECHKENVSSTAESCPSCGYNIKAHFEKTKEQIKQEKLATAMSYQKDIKFKSYESEIKAKQKEIDDIIEPKKPNYFLSLFNKDICFMTYAILVGPCITFLFCMLCGIENVLLFLYVAIGVLGSPIWLLLHFSDYKNAVELYKKELQLFNSNKEEWEKQKENKKEWIANQYKFRADMEVENQYAPKSENNLKCPICNNTDIEKITTMDRSVSLAVVGLASGKIGKQYRCKKCKHMW